MKELLLGLVLLNSFSVFATEIKLQNIPTAVLSVTTLGTIKEVSSNKTPLLSRHDNDQEAALEELKMYVHGELNRQVIEAKCDSPKGFETGRRRGVKSTCSVSFL